MQKKLTWAGVLALGSLAVGCTNKTEQCLKTTEETYKRTVAACADDACKAQALKTRNDFAAACQK